MVKFSEWLGKKMEDDNLSLRKAAAMVGISHGTIADILKGVSPTPETIKKLAVAFSGDGSRTRLAMEDELLVMAGYRTEREDEGEISTAMARLMDEVAEFSEPQLRLMTEFAKFLVENEGV